MATYYVGTNKGQNRYLSVFSFAKYFYSCPKIADCRTSNSSCLLKYFFTYFIGNLPINT